MHKRLLWLLNGAIVFGTVAVLLLHFSNTPRSNALPLNINLPGSAPA